LARRTERLERNPLSQSIHRPAELALAAALDRRSPRTAGRVSKRLRSGGERKPAAARVTTRRLAKEEHPPGPSHALSASSSQAS
jgi:hypothetical protein